jgi:hypothetical protein
MTLIITMLVLLVLGFLLFRAFAGESMNSLGGINMASTTTGMAQSTESGPDSNRVEKSTSTNVATNSTDASTLFAATTSAANENNSETQRAFAINVSDLSAEQQTMLMAAGFSGGNEIVITTTMNTCAENSIGVERTSAIATGAKPSFSEGAQLLVCYNQ